MEHWPLNVPSNSSDSVVLWTAMVLSQLSPVTSASSPWLRIVGSVCHWAGDPRMFQLPCLSWVLKTHVFLECLSQLSQPHHCTQWFYISLRAGWFYEVVILALDCVFTFFFSLLPAAREKSCKSYWKKADPTPVCAVIPWECGGHPGCVPIHTRRSLLWASKGSAGRQWELAKGTAPVHQWELLACSLAEASFKDGSVNGEGIWVSVGL